MNIKTNIMNYTEQLHALRNRCIETIQTLIGWDDVAVDSKHITGSKCLFIVDDNLCFSLDSGYLEELHKDKIVDTDGYHYSYDVLSTDELLRITDYFFCPINNTEQIENVYLGK